MFNLFIQKNTSDDKAARQEFKYYLQTRADDSETYDLSSYRLRFFFRHNFAESSRTAKYGIIVGDRQIIQGVVGFCDDWRLVTRPPRVDVSGYKFDQEVGITFPVLSLSGGGSSQPSGKNASVTFAYGNGGEMTVRFADGDLASSYSYLGYDSGLYENPLNVILEEKTSEAQISKISCVSNLVTVITSSAHGFSTGDAVCITGIPTSESGVSDTRDHLFGGTGERYMGTFFITVTGSNSFTYQTYNNLGSGESPASYTTGVCQKWTACVYRMTASSVSGDGSGTVSLTVSPDSASGCNFRPGDRIVISGSSSYSGSALITAVDSSDSHLLTLSIPGNTATASETGYVSFSPRPPSDAVPVNYQSGYSQSIGYDHTANTRLVYASKDTYDSRNNPSSTHANANPLMVRYDASETNRTYYKFDIPGDIVSGTDKIGEIGLYATFIGGASSTLELSQLTSGAWDPLSTTYDEYTALRSDTIGEAVYVNAPTDSLHCYFKYSIPSDRINAWISGKDASGNLTPPSVTMYKTSKYVDTITISIASTEDLEFRPYLVISGGVVTDTTKPSLYFSDMYSYLVLSSVDAADVSGERILTAHVDTTAFTDPHDVKYVRSGNFIQTGDRVELFGTVRLDTYFATVTGITYDAGDKYPVSIQIKDSSGNTSTESEPYAVLRCVSAATVTYTATDDTALSSSGFSVSPDSVVRSETPYPQGSSEYTEDVKCDFSKSSYMNATVADLAGNVSPDYCYPIITGFTVVGKEKFDYIGKSAALNVSGVNIDSQLGLFCTNCSPYVMFGDPDLEGGFSGVRVGLPASALGQYSFTVDKPALQYEVTVKSVTSSDGVSVFEITGDYLPSAGDPIAFIPTGDLYIDHGCTFPEGATPSSVPFVYGKHYYVASADTSGGTSRITITPEYVSKIHPGSPSDYERVLVTTDMSGTPTYLYGYNPISAFYATNSRYGSVYSKFNRLYIKLDEFGPKVIIGPIESSESKFYVYVSDLSGVDTSESSFKYSKNARLDSVEYMSGNGFSGTGDSRFVRFTMTALSSGKFTVYEISDLASNKASAVSSQIPGTLHFVVKSISVSPSLTMVLSVYGEVPAAVMTDIGTSQGVFVEGSVAGSPFGQISAITTTDYGLDVTVSSASAGNGIITAYARDIYGATCYIVPPVIMSLSNACGKVGSVVTARGANLSGRTVIYGKMTSADTLSLSLNSSNFGFPAEGVSADPKSQDVIILSESGLTDGSGKLSMSLSNGKDSVQSNELPVAVYGVPKIIIGSFYYEIKKGEAYVDPDDITATDSFGGDIKASLSVSGSVDTTTLGDYVLTYTVHDSCGNAASAVRTVKVVTGCPLYIAVTPSSGYTGTVVRITATEGMFNPSIFSNTVYFGGVPAVISPNSSYDRYYLDVAVPSGAVSGYVGVNTGTDNDGFENCPDSNVTYFTVLHSVSDSEVTAGGSAVTNASGNLVKSAFNKRSKSAIYNRDYGFSGFTEITDENSMVQNVYSILLTRIGERLYNMDFGSTIEGRVFSLINNETTSDSVLSECISLIGKYEPRVSVDTSVSSASVNKDAGEIIVILGLVLPSGNCDRIYLTFSGRGV